MKLKKVGNIMDKNGIDSMIATLYDMIQDAKGIPLSSGKCIIEREKVLDMLDDMSEYLPEDIKKSRSIVSSRNEIIGQARNEAEATITAAKAESDGIISRAKAEAETTIENAKATAKQMIAKETVVQEAQKQAKEIVDTAQRQSKEMLDSTNAQIDALKKASNDYMSESLRKTEEVISAALKDVKDTRAKFTTLTADKKAAEKKPAFNVDLN
jgi:cell division septum initiation protein DivIVA